MIEKIQEVPAHPQILARFPGQVLQVVPGQWRLGAMQAEKAHFHLVRRVFMFRRQGRNHITARKAQTGRGREPDTLLPGLAVAGVFQVVAVVPVNQVHQLEKTVTPRVAEDRFQPGYISGC